MGLADIFRGLTSLFFPSLCLHCRRSLDRGSDLLCVGCDADLPLSDSYLQPENAVTDRLAGRFPLTYGAYAYTFRDGTVCQRLIHALKYHDRPDVGVALGRRFGTYLQSAEPLRGLTGIVPVPIHRRRRRQRGYNQAEEIACGLAESLSVTVYPDALQRAAFAGSQTKRDKLQRLENVRHSFRVGRGDFRNGHLLLVDDVLTTGATIDFCAEALIAAHPGLQISVVTLAVAER
ncbi:ComF family protein [Neolewinella xylanilytica]|uniref:ComF family protein n=1 Tax=Neolewinella xylanilytica TaxID=1514080 RepID=A0A2S6I3S1_9BACT|nr:ComF family protein [Neolewinella xylanilytica]PPK85711.1 ComF family protein [Neolewinella xylanilytica]